MEVTALWRYPVKSLAPLVEQSLTVGPGGPVGDRRWAVVDEEGARITGRTERSLLHVRAEVLPDGLRLISPDGPEIEVREPNDGPRVDVDFSRLPTAVYAGDEAAAFFSKVLGRPVRLVWQPDVSERTIKPDNGGLDGEVLSLADAGPLLLTSESSLARLQEWVGEEPTLAMGRFRPNVVVDGGEPFEEDGWGSVRIGDVDFRVQQTCDRCVFTTIDPVTLERGPEPIRTLSRHRKWDGKVWFGIWLVPAGTGSLAVRDQVHVVPGAPADR